MAAVPDTWGSTPQFSPMLLTSPTRKVIQGWPQGNIRLRGSWPSFGPPKLQSQGAYAALGSLLCALPAACAAFPQEPAELAWQALPKVGAL